MAVRVVLDARGLSGAAAYRGVGTYVRELLDALARREDVSVAALVARRDGLPERVRAVRVARLAPDRFAHAEHGLWLALDLARTPGDVLHVPTEQLPRRWRRPLVATLHGFAPMVAAPALAVERHRLLKARPRLARAAALVAVSRFCADEAVRHLGLDRRRIHVITHGVHPAFAPEGPRHDLGRPYLLVVAEHGPTKGFAEAFAVASALAEAGYPHRLLVVGRLAPWVAPEVLRLVAAAPRPDVVVLEGHLDHREQLPARYRGASALVVTSRYESFCLPALEAMACGTPVVAFANSALPEVLGGAGLLVPDGDVAAMVGALRRLLDSPSARHELGEAGLARARRFDWGGAAAAHAELYQEVARAR